MKTKVLFPILKKFQKNEITKTTQKEIKGGDDSIIIEDVVDL